MIVMEKEAFSILSFCVFYGYTGALLSAEIPLCMCCSLVDAVSNPS